MVKQFILILNSRNGVSVTETTISQNVFEYRGRNTVLLYVKGRARAPYRWGVTANVVERLSGAVLPWIIILLFDTHEKGYVLSSRDTERYMGGVWPLAADGDYKPAAGSYLSYNSPLLSIDAIIEEIESIGAS